MFVYCLHRQRCREYTKLYTQKLLAKSVSTALKTKLEVRTALYIMMWGSVCVCVCVWVGGGGMETCL